MVLATPAAIAKLGELIVEHPEDPVVRLTIIDNDDERIIFRDHARIGGSARRPGPRL